MEQNDHSKSCMYWMQVCTKTMLKHHDSNTSFLVLTAKGVDNRGAEGPPTTNKLSTSL